MEEDRFRWWRPQRAYVEEGLLRIEVGSLNDAYYPLLVPNLPNAFARVTDGNTAVEFAQRYGFLGYSALVVIEERAGGDPLTWVLQHASSVGFILELIALIAEKDGERLRDTFRHRAIEVPDDKVLFPVLPGTHMNIIQGHYPLSVKSRHILFPLLFSGGPEEDLPLSHARHLIAYAVNKNTDSMTRRLIPFHDRLDESFHCSSLIEAIWWLVGNMALEAERNTGAVRRCQECGSPFVVTDRRQRFCPGDEWSKVSLCGARHRTRKWRKKGGDNNGKGSQGSG